MEEPISDKYGKWGNQVKLNQRIFAILLITLQIAISLLYAFFGQAPLSTINLNSVISAIFFAFLAIVGFGMYFSYLKRLLWSGIGFSLLITALSIQYYPLINAFWAKVGVNTTGVYTESFSNKYFKLFVANFDSNNYENNTITSAVKAALAIIVAFGSVIGRVGPLQCLLMTTVGIFGYELNRNVIMSLGQDVFGTFSIFTFGGFLGLAIGIVLAIREKKKDVITYEHPMLGGNIASTSQSALGVLFIFILFPFLAYEGDQSLQAPFFQRLISPISVLLSMGSAVITSIGVGMIIYGDNSQSIRAKDVLNAVVAGGVISGAASFYITAPFLAIIVGSISGLFQYLFDNVIERYAYKKWGHFSTYSYTLFCLQGLIGAIFAAGYNTSITNQGSNGFVYSSTMNNGGYEIIIYLISAGFGVGCGLFIGLCCYILNQFDTQDMFVDKTTFVVRDGIHYRKQPKIVLEQNKSQMQKKVSDKQKVDETQNHQLLLLPTVQKPEIEVIDSPPSSISNVSFDFADMLQVVMD